MGKLIVMKPLDERLAELRKKRAALDVAIQQLGVPAASLRIFTLAYCMQGDRSEVRDAQKLGLVHRNTTARVYFTQGQPPR